MPCPNKFGWRSQLPVAHMAGAVASMAHIFVLMIGVVALMTRIVARTAGILVQIACVLGMMPGRFQDGPMVRYISHWSWFALSGFGPALAACQQDSHLISKSHVALEGNRPCPDKHD